MQKERYLPVSDESRRTYEFLSSGPKGAVKKVVQYSKMDDDLYNLGFGDWDEEKQEIKDDVRTNNDDRDKVLATVAYTVFDFMEHYPTAQIFAMGSTPARTRLYQIGISVNLSEIEKQFQVEGFVNRSWEPFTKGKNYQAFILKAK